MPTKICPKFGMIKVGSAWFLTAYRQRSLLEKRMIVYMFRKPKFPIICNIDGFLVTAGSNPLFQRRMKKQNLKSKQYRAIDATGECWELYADQMFMTPSLLKRRWSKKEIIQMYNESKNSQEIKTKYSEKSLSNKRFEKIYSDIVELLEQCQ